MLYKEGEIKIENKNEIIKIEIEIRIEIKIAKVQNEEKDGVWDWQFDIWEENCKNWPPSFSCQAPGKRIVKFIKIMERICSFTFRLDLEKAADMGNVYLCCFVPGFWTLC